MPNWDRDLTVQAVGLRERIQQNFEERKETKRLLRSLRPAPPGRPAPPQPESYDVLVLSAGGQFGAYGSGFLKGWSDRSDLQPDRAEIDMVTGVSTGALMATYAYLGSSDNAATRAEYDALLKAQYTTLSNDDVFRTRSRNFSRHNDAFRGDDIMSFRRTSSLSACWRQAGALASIGQCALRYLPTHEPCVGTTTHRVVPNTKAA